MADQITKLHLDVNAISNHGELLLLANRSIKKYIDGKPSDELEYKCTVVAPMNGYEKYEITVAEKPAFDVQEGSPIAVAFQELSVKLYRKFDDGVAGYGLSCRAKAVTPVKKA